ncbi:MAG: efflux RND transporter permease subunit, partial [Acidobacteria bacterium]|nr:efflux RND transporter permease subunit [Acidobacteriota bacterium]
KEEPFVVEKSRTYALYSKIMKPMLDKAFVRWAFLLGVVALLVISASAFLFKFVTVKMLPFDNKSEFQVIIDMPEGTTLEQSNRVAKDIAEYIRTVSEVTDYQIYAGTAAPYNFNGLVRHYFLRRGTNVADLQVNLVHKGERSDQSHDIAKRVRPEIQRIAERHNAAVKVVEIPPGPPVLSTLVTEVYGPTQEQRIDIARRILDIYNRTGSVVDIDWFVEDEMVKYDFVVDKEKAMLSGVTTEDVAQTLNLALSGMKAGVVHMPREKEPVSIQLRLALAERSSLEDLREIPVMTPMGQAVPLGELVRIEQTVIDKAIHHKNLRPVVYVVGDVAGVEESPVYAILKMADEIDKITLPGGARIEQWYTRQPWSEERVEIKWDGEWHITYEVFRDMGLAFAAVMVLMYVLLVGWFKRFKVPLVQMAAIPLTLIGIVPAHMIFGAFFTATSMIGMIALAGIMVRNSVLLIDFIDLRMSEGLDVKQAIIESGAVRFRPIALTAGTMIVGAIFILLDPIFQGLALSLMAGGISSTVLTLAVVPILYFMVEKPSLKTQ